MLLWLVKFKPIDLLFSLMNIVVRLVFKNILNWSPSAPKYWAISVMERSPKTAANKGTGSCRSSAVDGLWRLKQGVALGKPQFLHLREDNQANIMEPL